MQEAYLGEMPMKDRREGVAEVGESLQTHAGLIPVKEKEKKGLARKSLKLQCSSQKFCQANGKSSSKGPC